MTLPIALTIRGLSRPSGPLTIFRCERFACLLSARACVARQGARPECGACVQGDAAKGAMS